MGNAKLFWSGRSQALRLPKEFRFSGQEVSIRRQGRAVILEPLEEGWDWLDEIAGRLSDDFLAEGREQPALPDNPDLDELFG